MTARVLTGTKHEIAQKVASLEGEVREAIVFIEEPSAAPPLAATTAEDLFAEMEPYVVRVGNADHSRVAVYSRLPGE
jgi:hypothetical protein